MILKIPQLSLVVLIGPSGCGKTTFARTHFGPFETISSDFCRGLVSNDENALDVNDAAFEVLYAIARKRLARGLLTVIDATNVSPSSRKGFVQLAREFHVLPVAIVFDIPKHVCLERNAHRPDRGFGGQVIINQHREMSRSLRGLSKEGFRHIHVLKSIEEVAEASIFRDRLYNDKRDEHGPFDIIGDVHGCYEELVDLLKKLGWKVGENEELEQPAGRKIIFLGDLVDRGPATPRVLRLVMRAVGEGKALCVPGNHDIKLKRALTGAQVKIAHGLQESLDQLAQETGEFLSDVVSFIDGLVSHYVLDDGKLVVAHAGMKEEMQGRGGGGVREFALYGETTGETDEFGFPVRVKWAEEYRGKALVIYGHTPVPEPESLNRTLNIDTGCVFGGKLTAYRHPERELVSVPARHEHAVSRRPLLAKGSTLSAQQLHDGLLYMEDVFGKRGIETRLMRHVRVREENAAPALEIMSRYGADPRWLIYLPPTMSPSDTSRLEGLLEHPQEAFGYYLANGVSRVICEEKHMGSRAVLVLCASEEAARRRFGITDGSVGTIYTRTGRPFFPKAETEHEVLEELRASFERAGAWKSLETDWICLDCELMPWSAKARELLVRQYAPVGAAAKATLAAAQEQLSVALARGMEGLDDVLARTQERAAAVERYIVAYGRYCWEVEGIGGYKLAPFHILATENGTHVDRDHGWHMEIIHGIVERAQSALLHATRYRAVDLENEAERLAAADWWAKLTESGGEGMVVKPWDFIATGRRGLLQPAIKCRGREYLRIIYGPEYTLEKNLSRLRDRGLSGKRNLALREFALGIEALERFLRKEPLRRVHECVLGVLALESEPVDPRL